MLLMTANILTFIIKVKHISTNCPTIYSTPPKCSGIKESKIHFHYFILLMKPKVKNWTKASQETLLAEFT